jgi:catechol 2,3-dioxygenase-like lactoylglutathione lyase family enzyme
MSDENGSQVSVRGWLHVEVVHPDPDAAAKFLCDTLGGRIVERELCENLKSLAEGVGCVHVLVAGVVFQLVRPIEGLEPWYSVLKEQGPCVHNVTFNVDGLEHAREVLEAAGATKAAELDVPLGAMSKSELNRVYVMDARQQAGIRIEMADVPGWIGGEAP